MNNELVDALQGCLNPNTVHQSEQKLDQLTYQHNFTQQLLRLIPQIREPSLLIMLLTTLKNYLLHRYNSDEGRIHDSQKDILKSSIFDLFYLIKNNASAVKLYKQIIYVVVSVDFPWNGVDVQLINDLENRIQAGIYFTRQVAKVYQYLQGEDRVPYQNFMNNIFPKLQPLVEQILSNFNEDTSKCLQQILQAFYSSFHISIPNYLRNFGNLQKWITFFKFIFNAPCSPLIENNQKQVSRIYTRFFSLYCNINQNSNTYPNWAQTFINSYAGPIFEQVYQLVLSKVGTQSILANLINCLHQIAKSAELRPLLTYQHISQLFYQGTLLPLCQSTKYQLELFQNDQIEYIRREDDLTCSQLRRSILDFIQIATNKIAFNEKPQLMRMVQYCAAIIQNQSSGDNQKQVVIRILIKLGTSLIKRKYFKDNFQKLTEAYFQPMLAINNKILNAFMCNLLSQYLPFADLSPRVVSSLMQQIYAKILEKSCLVLTYNAILAFTSLLHHKTALQAAKPHFSTILKIYVDTLNTLDHQNLIGCLQSIVKHFQSQIVECAGQLINHLLNMFFSLAKKSNNNDDGYESDEDEPDANSPASATLSTIKQILNCKLSGQLYLDVSVQLTNILRQVFDNYSSYFDEILTLFAVLCHNAPAIADYEYPYAVCRWLLQGKNFNLSASRLPNNVINEISKLDKADYDWEDNLVAILKNIIQKAPDQILRSYPWPKHQELILALIQNKRLSPQEIDCLDTSEVQPLWSAYLAAYSLLIYNKGQLCPPQNLRLIVGVSLFPWLKEGINPKLIKLVTQSIDEDEEDQDFEQNTAQMLQRYANEEEQDSQEYQQTSGTNFTYLYTSPFDAGKDRELLISHIKSLDQNVAINLINSLNSSSRKRLQIMMNQNQ